MTTDITTTITGYFVGLDLGQAQDHSAIAVARRLEDSALYNAYDVAPSDIAAGGSPEFRAGNVKSRTTHFDVVHLERLPLGTAYPAVVKRAHQVVTRVASLSQWAAHLVVDYTGVGRPVVDMIRREHPTLRPIPLLITGGDKATLEGGTWKVPKRDLVGSLQVLLQTKRLKIAKALVHAATLVDELLNFRVRINELTAHDSYGAWREGEHDDLVLATAVACWYGVRTDAKPWTLESYPIIHD